MHYNTQQILILCICFIKCVFGADDGCIVDFYGLSKTKGPSSSNSSNSILLKPSPEFKLYAVDSTLSFSEPQNKDEILAGTFASIIVSSSPPDKFTVKFSCDDGSPSIYLYDVVTDVESKLFIPANYRSSCEFTVVDYPEIYPTVTPVQVKIMQQLTISLPENGKLYDPFAPLPILLKSTSPTVNRSAVLEINCSSGTPETISVRTNAVNSYDNTSGIAGNCSISTNKIERYFIPAQIVYFNFGILIAFNKTPIQVANGLAFEFSVKTISVSTVSATIDIELKCPEATQTFNGIPFNSISVQIANLPLSGTGPFSCALQSLPDPRFNPISVAVTVLIPLSPDQKSQVARDFVITGGFL